MPIMSETKPLSATQAARLLIEFGHANHDSAEGVLAEIIKSGEPFNLGATVAGTGIERVQLAYAGEGVWTLAAADFFDAGRQAAT
jgi:hypothetical protein